MLRNVRSWARRLGVAAVLLPFACGGESAETEPERVLNTGLDPALRLDEVSSEQARQACQAFRQAVQDNYDTDTGVQRGCEAFGASTAQDAPACENLASACMMQVEEGTNPLLSRERLELELPSCEGDVSRFQNCSETVGALEECVHDRFVGFLSLLDAATCDQAADVTLADLMEITGYWSSTGPVSCAEFEAQCPEVIRF